MDGDFERDEAAIDAMIGDFRGKRFREVPPDPRRIDADRVRALRTRLVDPYAYRWRATEADAALVDALFHTVVQSNGMRYGLCIEKIALNEAGEGPPLVVGPRGHARFMNSDAYTLHHYVTACSMDVRAFITSYDEAVRLLDSLLPGTAFTLRRAEGHTAVRLERGGQAGPFVEAGYAALAVVLALLEHLERLPHEAAHWRGI